MPSLDFSGLSSHRVNIGSGASLDNVNAGTLIVRGRLGSIADGRFFQKGTFGSSDYHYFGINGAQSRLEFSRKRATTDCGAQATFANFSGHATNQWGWYAAVWNTAGVNGDQKLFYATDGTPFAEPSAYFSQGVGSGAVGDNSAADAFLGNNAGLALALPGRMARVILYNVALTLAQLRAIQFSHLVLAGRIGHWELGWTGTGTQVDYSGRGNTGTVTGATLAAGPPDASVFGGRVKRSYPIVVSSSFDRQTISRGIARGIARGIR